MSSVGFYRYKTTADAAKTVSWIVNYVVAATKEIVPVDICTGDLIIKYLDKNGQYRFYPFSRNYETNDNPVKIGSANKFVTDILNDQSNTKNLGYKNERKIDASADVPKDELEKLADIYTSPRVYLYIGSGGDALSDWLEVEIRAARNVVRRRRSNMGGINITITLPENYSITML